jgi:hypothetical protein
MNPQPSKFDLKFTLLAVIIIAVVIAVLYSTRKSSVREDQEMIEKSNGKETRDLFNKLEKARSWNDSGSTNK